MEVIDRKFTISARCLEHGHPHSEADAVLFLAHDRALIPTLQFYRDECQALGADARQIEGVDMLIGRVREWQRRYSNVLKVADVEAGPTGDRIVAPNAPASQITY